MLLFLHFHRHALFADWTVFFQLEIFPADPLAVLLVESDGSDPLVTFRAEHGENGALTSWHSGRILLGFAQEASAVLPTFLGR